jgi:hypothetical protein
MVTLLFTTLLSLIIVGSTIAFNIITSLGQVGYLILPYCYWLHLRKASSWGSPTPFPIRSWASWYPSEWSGSLILVSRIRLLFLPQCAEPEPRRHELEFSYYWVCLIILANLLLFIWQTSPCRSCRVYQTSAA